LARRAGSGMAGQGFVEPMMPTLVEKPPEGGGWIHEIKFDGYRTQIVISGKKARAYTRRGLDWTKKYGRIVGAARELGHDCHLEGEIIVQDANGRPDFNALRSDIESGAGGRLIFYAFDLLSLDGLDLRAKPCEERRALLSDLLGSPAGSFPIHFSEAHDGPGAAFLAAVEKIDLEGMVSKNRNSPYRSGYTKAWLKVKTFVESEFTVVGYDTTPGGVRSLLVAREHAGQLNYAGRVMVTLRGRKREEIWAQLEEHRTDRPPLPELQHGNEVEWFAPGVHVRVRHLRGEETLRHATLLGLAWPFSCA
jgi:bifunctional non-homologous end joining protein LigD